ncbi:MULTISPECIES: choline ABC transporter substrate-binding protein [Pseudomonas]|jgi:glycine betaine/proline transport system substrate-binding protein|uniref:Glycine/betaine ABC transporter substrate-binding protein n=1 Tax=Pseudomonas marincola TaxID=437900 RepID=A0A653E091_9PSED|nr:choline ABC transporter substrate-binding protein [Pseudomonas marincola]MBQ57021.1 glycine/betaine ABC transporter substrate-binding protein [Pseudomonadaceae bacterium]CAE6945574.1 Glycine/betaine ABC transporter substrate-binding protein [Pseudomonas marincola]HCP54401.1 glycine/betaine ABC transporter substrate-binding protein [Pseudomonas sp.]
MNRLKLIAAGCVLALSSSSLLAAEQASCKNVRVGLVGWTDVVATTAVASTLLEGLGYETKQTQASQQIIFAGIQKDQIDVFLGYWKPIMDDNIKPFLDKKAVKVMPEPSLNDAVAVLAVPTYTADKGLKTLADIAKFKDQLDGKIYGIDAGSGANIAIKKMIDSNQFGLGDFKLVESSEAGMLAAVNRATRSDKPVVFFGWKPHPMNLQFPITYLTGTEDVFGPNDGAATVSTVTAPDYAERCPNANLLLSNLRFTSEQESQLMQPIMDRKKPEDVAREWIKANPEIVSGWLQGVTTFDGKPADSAIAALK